MSEPLENTTSAESMSSLADSHARIFQMPVCVPVLGESAVDFGVSTRESLANYDPTSCSWRTSEHYSQAKDGAKNQMINAYAAGLIDGEGCITIAHREMTSFSVRIDVGMSAKGMPCLTKLRDSFGGKIRKTREKTEKWEEAYAWALFGKATVPFLQAVSPHLVLKAEQARYALSLQSLIANLPLARKGVAAWTPEAREEAACIRALVMELNRKGPEMEGSTGWTARLVGGKWLTPQRDLFSSLQWAEFSETWPRSGMTRSGKLYPLPTLGRRTLENGSGYWATPVAQPANGTPEAFLHRKRESVARGNSMGVCLSDLAMQVKANAAGWWPTPRANDAEKRGNFDITNPRNGLPAAVKMFATPQARDFRTGQASRWDNRQRSRTLNDQCAKYPTPTATMYKGSSPAALTRRNGRNRENDRLDHAMLAREGSGQLNPTWVEWLMGYPSGWTDLEDLATP
jgi:hypothetical protein